VAALPRCPNCSAEREEEYCPRCGQRRIPPQELSARHFLEEVADEITDFRKNYKTVRTLLALLRPGLLTAEFLAGRRRPRLSPFKTYLVCAAIFFLSAPVAGFTLAKMLEDDQSGMMRGLAAARAAERHLDQPLFNARFDVRVQSVYTVTLGAAAVVFALTLQVLFRRQGRPYGAHLMFALHYTAFMLLVTVLAGLSRRIGASIDIAAFGGYILIFPYLILALKRVYAESAVAIVWKGTVLILVTMVLNSLASFAAIHVTLALV